MSKVYVLSTIKGVWDDATSIILGVYDSLQGADRGEGLWLAQLQQVKNRYTKAERTKLEQESDKLIDRGIPSDKWPKEINKYWNWKFMTEPHEYSDHVQVDELELNTITHKIEDK